MKSLLAVLLVATIAQEAIYKPYRYPLVDAILNLHWPGDTENAGVITFWRYSDDPNDYNMDDFFVNFHPTGNKSWIAILYNASNTGDSCRPTGPPFLAYHTGLQKYLPAILFAVHYTSHQPHSFEVILSNANAKSGNTHNILNLAVHMYPSSRDYFTNSEQYLDWKNSPEATLCGVIKPSSSELKHIAMPDGWKPQQYDNSVHRTIQLRLRYG